MDIKGIIKGVLANKEAVKVADIVEITGFSRAYINRFFSQLVDEGEIVLFGKANKAHYIAGNRETIAKERLKIKNAGILDYLA